METKEAHKRSIVKAITFRVVVMCADFLVVMFITHQYKIALGFVLLSNVSSTVLYYLHERFWNKVKWGRS